MILGIAALFLPLSAIWRAALAALLCFVAIWQVAGPVLWPGPGLARGWRSVADAILGRNHCKSGAAPDHRWHPEANNLCAACRFGLVLARRRAHGPSGIVPGYFLFSELALWLAGSGVGSWFDWAVAIIGLGTGTTLTILTFAWRSLWPVLPAATLCVLGALALWGAGQPSRIVTQAEALADGHAWRLTRTRYGPPIDGIEDLGFFGMWKSDRHHHLVLVTRDPEGATRYYWSIRRQRFYVLVPFRH